MRRERRGEVPPDYRTSQAYFDSFAELGIGFYLQGTWPFRTVYDEPVKTVTRQDGNLRQTTLETPLGVIRTSWTYLPELFAEAPPNFTSDLAGSGGAALCVRAHPLSSPIMRSLSAGSPWLARKG